MNQSGMSLVLCLGVLTGCAAQVGEQPLDDDEAVPVESDDEEVRSRLTALGFDADSAHQVGNNISVGDIGLDRAKLLAGEYDWALGEKAGEHGEKSSYVGGTPLHWLQSTNIKIVWSTAATDAPTLAIKNAVVNAAGDINATCNGTPSCLIHFSQNNTGPWVVVHMTPAVNWPPPACAGQTNIVGCATWPSSGAPGGHVYFKAGSLSANCSSWTTEALAYITRHEMMHTLGFNHKGVGTVVPNTLANPATTVMMPANNFVLPACTLSPTLLQTDDKAGLRNIPIDTSL